MVYKTEEQDLAVQCNTRLLVFTPHNAYMAQKCRPGFNRALLFTAPVHASVRVELMLLRWFSSSVCSSVARMKSQTQR